MCSKSCWRLGFNRALVAAAGGLLAVSSVVLDLRFRSGVRGESVGGQERQGSRWREPVKAGDGAVGGWRFSAKETRERGWR